MEEAEVAGHWLNRLGITVKRRVYYEQSAANPVELDRLTDLLEAEAAREAVSYTHLCAWAHARP